MSKQLSPDTAANKDPEASAVLVAAVISRAVAWGTANLNVDRLIRAAAHLDVVKASPNVIP